MDGISAPSLAVSNSPLAVTCDVKRGNYPGLVIWRRTIQGDDRPPLGHEGRIEKIYRPTQTANNAHQSPQRGRDVKDFDLLVCFLSNDG